MAKKIKEYQWDVAISLSKEDIHFAKKLVRAINPNLKVFFYEDRQEELISNSGPEAFANIFKEDSRIVVILSRDEWSKSFYTEIERNAIIDRTAVKNEGYQFLMVIPMIQGEVPNWYPSTRIYADPHRFTVEELARFIEFKVIDKGGSVKSITVENRYQNLLERIDEKKSIIRLQETENAIKSANKEIKVLKDCFNSKSDFLKNKFIDSFFYLPYNEYSNNANFGLSDYLLECKIISPDETYHRIVTTQDFCISFEIFKIIENYEARKSIQKEKRFFYYTEQLKGWSLQYLFEQASNKELIVLFRNRDNQRYDLKNPVDTIKLVDGWFQKLLSISTQSIERYV